MIVRMCNYTSLLIVLILLGVPCQGDEFGARFHERLGEKLTQIQTSYEALDVDSLVHSVEQVVARARAQALLNVMDSEVSLSLRTGVESLRQGSIYGSIISEHLDHLHGVFEGKYGDDFNFFLFSSHCISSHPFIFTCSTIIDVNGRTQPDGLCKVSYDDDTVFIGMFQEGIRTGVGYLKLANGDKYFGEFEEGREQGLGNRTYRGDGWYAGEWRDGHPDGKGRRIWGDGKEYSGRWQHGVAQGIGQLVLRNGDVYLGGWKEGMESGFGTQKFHLKKESYAGVMKQGLPEGKGRYVHANGDVYSGSWVNGTATGLGRFFYKSSGDIYYGFHKNGLKHGKGEYHITAAGMVIVGTWEKGSRVGELMHELLDGRDIGFSFEKGYKPAVSKGDSWGSTEPTKDLTGAIPAPFSSKAKKTIDQGFVNQGLEIHL